MYHHELFSIIFDSSGAIGGQVSVTGVLIAEPMLIGLGSNFPD
jgi:hypothetical protein